MEISTGDLRMEYENGFLRYLQLGADEVLRKVYFAVRDANWGTVPLQIRNEKLKIDNSGFEVSYEAFSQHEIIDFQWQCKIIGKDNTVRFDILGRSYSSFLANRIGFCVLHPRECAGLPVTIGHTDGTLSMNAFPEMISPHQPFKAIKTMAWELASARIFLDFNGAVFETEDQRNWLDASYKTYCTPLELPFPVQIEPGHEVRQSIVLRVDAKTGFEQAVHPRKHRFSVLEDTYPLPCLGLESNAVTLNDWSMNKLRSLDLAHLRVTVNYLEEFGQAAFEQAVAQATAIGVPISLVLVTGADSDALQKQFSVVDWKGIEVKEVTVIDGRHKTTGTAFLNTVLPIVRSVFNDITIGGGTDYYFTEINREPPHMDLLDFCSFSANPQVHAFDDRSISETAATFYDMLQSGKVLSREKPVHISPITLRPRANPDATETLSPEEQLESRVDARQQAPLCAYWTLASIKQLVRGGVASATFFQTIGREGLLSQQGRRAFPVFKIFEFLGKHKGGRMLDAVSSSPLEFDGLVLEKKGKRYAALFNLTDKMIDVHFMGQLTTLDPGEIKFWG